jgi:hypothetical protein
VRQRAEAEIEKREKTLKENSEDSSAEFGQLLIDASNLRSKSAMRKLIHSQNLRRLEHAKTSQLSAIQKKHEAAMSSLDQEYDAKIKFLEAQHSSLMDKAKRELVADLKSSDELNALQSEQTVQKEKLDLEIKAAEELEAQQESWETELSELADQIEAKTLEKKELAARHQRDCADRNQKIAQLREEIRQRETEWYQEKQRLTNEWNAKFDHILRQFREEENHNENTRRLPEQECQRIVEGLKQELADEDVRKAAELAKINQQIDAERQRNAVEVRRLREELDSLQGDAETSVQALTQRLEQLGAERAAKIQKAEDQKRIEIHNHTQKFREARRRCRLELNTERLRALNLLHQEQQRLYEAKRRLELAQLESQFDIAVFRAERELEIAQLENHHHHQIELLNIGLQGLQSETESLQEQHQRRMLELEDLQRNRLSEQADEFEAGRNKLEVASQALIASKSQVIEELRAEVGQAEAELQIRGARPEDPEHIARLEEIIAERRETLDALAADHRRYEAAMIETETCFNKLVADQPHTSESVPSMLDSVAGKRIRIDGTVSGRRRTVIEPSITPKKSRSPL